jgi:hypothetical protein
MIIRSQADVLICALLERERGLRRAVNVRPVFFETRFHDEESENQIS